MTERYKRAMEQVTLPAEADERILAELVRADALRNREDPNMKHYGKNIVRAVLVAAAVTALLAATVYAVGGRIKMKITRGRQEEQKVSVELVQTDRTQNEQILLEEKLTETEQEMSVYEAQYQFPKEDPGAYIELGDWKPSEIPAGYEESFLSDRAYGAQVILYENEDGEEIRFEYAKPSGFGGVTMYGVISEETVDIGGSEGRLFRRTQGGSLFWLREIDGIGFYLTSFDPDVDLIAMARSVSRCDPYGSAEADANTEAALLQLGDYSAAWLPQGFTERDIMGVPVPEGGWYGYVRRFYTDKETNREAVFWYEPFVVPPDAAAQDANEHFRSIHNEDAHVATTIDEASVNGHVAMIHVAPAMNSIHWLDAEQGLEFGISSSALTVEELVQMAESVASSESAQ